MSKHWLGRWFLCALFCFLVGVFAGVPLDAFWFVFSAMFGLLGLLVWSDVRQRARAIDESES